MVSINANAVLCFSKMMDSVGYRGCSVIWTTGIQHPSTHMKYIKCYLSFHL